MVKNPLLLECPFPIKTKRLVMRPVKAGDGKQLNECIIESFEQFRKWLPWAQQVQTVDESELFVRASYAEFILRKGFHCGIFRDDRLVAMCALNQLDWNIPSATLGYWCRVSEQGKGYVQEAVQALTLYGFNQLGLRRIGIRCEQANKASRAVAEKCGFVLEGSQKGILSFPGRKDLLESNTYVRFDTADLDTKVVSW